MAADDTAQRKTKFRSPSYPWIDLREAIDKARAFYREERRNSAPVHAATAHWGYRPKASSGLLCVAALKKFGLMTDEGNGDARHVRLTELALKITLDERDESRDRDEAIKIAALTPKIHKALWERYGADLPSAATIRTYLVLNLSFAEEAADDLIKEYKKTISFANLDSSDRMEVGADNSNDEDDRPRTMPSATNNQVPSGVTMVPATAPQVHQQHEFPASLPGCQLRMGSLPIDDSRSFDFRHPADLSPDEIDYVVNFFQLWKSRLVAKSKSSTGA